eukprot:scaffold44555_cov58-Phaeocystis_antarctica.AAC.3
MAALGHPSRVSAHSPTQQRACTYDTYGLSFSPRQPQYLIAKKIFAEPLVENSLRASLGSNAMLIAET